MQLIVLNVLNIAALITKLLNVATFCVQLQSYQGKSYSILQVVLIIYIHPVSHWIFEGRKIMRKNVWLGECHKCS